MVNAWSHSTCSEVHRHHSIPPQGWQPRHACGGHYGAVTDATWAFAGAVHADGAPLSGCLLTVSADMTTRLTVGMQGRFWELARPQIHGHALRCVAALPVTARGCVFASGSEEKVLRVFEAPGAFLQSWAAAAGEHAVPVVEVRFSLCIHVLLVLQQYHVVLHVQRCISNPPVSLLLCTCRCDSRSFFFQGVARGALVTALGLSNQALFDEEVDSTPGSNLPQHTTEGPDIAPHAAPCVLTGTNDVVFFFFTRVATDHTHSTQHE